MRSDDDGGSQSLTDESCERAKTYQQILYIRTPNLSRSAGGLVPAEMSGHDSAVHVRGNDHIAFAAQTAEERNLQEFVNGRVVCHHLMRLQTQTCLSQRLH